MKNRRGFLFGLVFIFAVALLSIFVLELTAVAQSTNPVVVQTTVSCATSVDGSVVGMQNPLTPPIVAAGFSGTLPAGNYYTQIAWYDAAGHITLVGPEVQTQLSGTGQLQVNLPANGMPATSAGMKVYIGSSSGSETLQGTSPGGATFTQSTPLAVGNAVPATNNTVCAIVANDAVWPSGTGYTVDMTSPAGDTVPGWPMQWQLLGPGTMQNLANGLPLYNGNVTYPTPLLARPYNHAQQSISGSLSMTGYNIVQIGKLGVGTSVPAWPIDVENGAVNASGGFILNGGQGVTSGQCLAANSDPFHTFNITVPCITSVGAIFYQAVQGNGVPTNQRGTLNFAPRLVVSDTNPTTTVDLATVGSGGSCTLCNFSFDNYGRVTGATSSSSAVTLTQTDVTSSRSLGTLFQNTSGAPMWVQGYITTTAGGADGAIACSNGPTSALGNTPFRENPTSTDSGGSAEFHIGVPIDWFYECTANGTMNPVLGKWFESVQ